MEWFGAIPERWNTRKIGDLFTERHETVSDSVYAPLSVSKGGIVPQISTVAKTNAGDNRKRVCIGDFVINSRSDRRGSSGVSQFDGSVSVINIVLAPRDEHNGRFFHYLLRSHAFIEEYYRNGRGIVADLWSTRYSEMKTINLPLPPREEQDQIVRFLDWKTSMIDRYIVAKLKQVALLDEQRKVVVNTALAKGGDGWRELRLNNLGTFRKGYGGSRDDDLPDGVACIRYGDVYRSGGMELFSPITRISPHVTQSYARIYKSEMFFALSGETKEDIGQALVNNIDEDTWCGGDSAILTVSSEANPSFLAYALLCPDAVKQKASLAKGDIIVHLSTSALKRIRIPIPPIDQQTKIVRMLDYETALVGQYIDKTFHEIQLIQEYRNSIINSAVTGQIDARNLVIPDFETLIDDSLRVVEEAYSMPQEEAKDAD